MDSVIVRKVETRRDFKVFFEFPWTVYKDDPNWVPPLLSQRRHLLDKRHNPSWEYLEGDYFVAWRGEKPVGTIAAFINHRHNEYWKENLGWFGFFEVFYDQEAASALLQTAAEYVKGRGATAIRGPANFTLNDECGLLIENFVQPLLLMPYNHAYYKELIENSGLGYDKVMDVVSLWTDPSRYLDQKGNLPEKLLRVVGKINERRSITTRPADPKILKKELELLREIYQKAWEKNWGFVPPTTREMDALFDSLRSYFHPALGVFGLVDGKEVSFMMGLPDMNQVLKHAYPRPGVPEVISLLKAFWHWKIRPKITRQRILLFGVIEGFRSMGVDAAVYLSYIQSSMKTIPNIDAGWILETNFNALNQGKLFGTSEHRRYRFYQKPLG